MLADGITALVYNGDQDFIVNWLGSRAWTLAMEWDGKDAFNNATVNDWHSDGELRSYGGFHFLQVYAAGHMVPLDQPVAALTMLNELIFGTLGNQKQM